MDRKRVLVLLTSVIMLTSLGSAFSRKETYPGKIKPLIHIKTTEYNEVEMRSNVDGRGCSKLSKKSKRINKTMKTNS